MRDLIIDTSTATCSVSLFQDAILIASYHEFIGRGHAEVLIPAIQNILDGAVPDQIFVNVGPGSFTGIRIGISAARALGLAWGITCHGYSTMQLMAATAIRTISDHKSLPETAAGAPLIDIIMTGGHGEYYVQSFDREMGAIGDILSLSPSDCRCNAPIRSGDKADSIVNDNDAIITKMVTPDTRLFAQLQPYKTLDVKPIYVRAPDAVAATVKHK